MQTPGCDESLPQTCQVGDLSGKHGTIENNTFVTTYTDDFASTALTPSFLGNLSLTIHFANKTRITCANFTLGGSSVGATGTNGTGGASSTGSATPTKTSPLQVTGLGAGNRNAVSLLSLMTILGLAFLL